MPSSSQQVACAFGRCSIREVSIAAASAINTIMAKRMGEMIPKSSPTLRMINSMRPRVFISVPNLAELWLPDPVRRAATNVPPNSFANACPVILPRNNDGCECHQNAQKHVSACCCRRTRWGLDRRRRHERFTKTADQEKGRDHTANHQTVTHGNTDRSPTVQFLCAVIRGQPRAP